jgi:surface antigen
MGMRFAWRRSRIEVGFPRLLGALDGLPQGLGPCDAQGLCFAADHFPPGQCTWYAQGRRPDLAGIVTGNASQWLERAYGRAAEGLTPARGALAVWLPGAAHAGADGHVGYVAAVRGGQILVDDSNWTPTPTSNPLEVHEHWMSANDVSGYIYAPTPAG